MHVAIIMDGNGRWAQARGLPRTAGHRAGGQAVRRIDADALAAALREYEGRERRFGGINAAGGGRLAGAHS